MAEVNICSEPRKIKSDTVSTVSPSISHEVIEEEIYTIVIVGDLSKFGYLCLQEI